MITPTHETIYTSQSLKHTYIPNEVKLNHLSLYLSPPREIVIHDLTSHVSEHFVGECLLSTQEQSVQRVVQLELVLSTHLIPDSGQDTSSVGLRREGRGQKGGHHLSILLHNWKNKKTISFMQKINTNMLLYSNCVTPLKQ